MKDLDDFNAEFGYSKDPEAIQKEKYRKSEMYREMSNLNAKHYDKYFYGLIPDD